MSKILIIEDDQIVGKIYRDKLSAGGYQVYLALDGQAGLEMVASTRPDLIILDLVLPKLSGIDVLKKVRATSGFEQTPVIVFSNTYLTTLVQQAWKAGATKCLSKVNCGPKEVIDVIAKTIRTQAEPLSSSATPASVQSISASHASDAASQADQRRSFLKNLPGTLASLRVQLQSLAKADNESDRLNQIQELYQGVHTLTGAASLARVSLIAQLAEALEALLEELREKPVNINDSTLRTAALAIDELSILSERRTLPDKQEIRPPRILVVDDDPISRRAITHALGKIRLKYIDVGGPNAAFYLLAANSFDLIFLDVDMPEMNGYELCTKLRTLPAHKKTPVVFVTALTDLKSRADSMVSGGNDFIVKPFLFSELAAKALVYVLRCRFEHAK